MSDLDRQEIIEKALEIFEDTTKDLYHLAQVANFSDEEIELVRLFSDSLGKDNKIIDSEKINIDWLGHENNRRCVLLINKKIERNFIENFDFVKTERGRLHNISFECLKSLLSSLKNKQSKDLRKSLIRIEQLSDIMDEVKLQIEIKSLKIQNDSYERRIISLNDLYNNMNDSYNNLVQQFQVAEKEIQSLKEKSKDTFCTKVKKALGM